MNNAKIISIEEAAALLQKGEVVAIPTETVYGLGGWINSEEGLQKIFSVKERPFFDPLIVHVSETARARELSSDWTEIHEVLAKKAWPGPLTLIAKKNDRINSLITSGLDSVGLRIPRHETTLNLLRMLGGGVAAPSANKFGKTSPTSSKHVFEEFGTLVPILEGGSSEVGIESTVAGVVNGQVEIYRPGFYTASMLEKILKEAGLATKVVYAQSPVAPGQLKHHYMPRIPLVIARKEFNWENDHRKIENALNQTFSHPVIWKQNANPHIASRELYEKMREFDQKGFDIIITLKEPQHLSEDWMGIWNRLSKAKTLEV
jgi:L-threonylcarbamoyladenylate synthase